MGRSPGSSATSRRCYGNPTGAHWTATAGEAGVSPSFIEMANRSHDPTFMITADGSCPWPCRPRPPSAPTGPRPPASGDSTAAGDRPSSLLRSH